MDLGRVPTARGRKIALYRFRKRIHQIPPVLLEVEHDLVLNLGEVDCRVRDDPCREDGAEKVSQPVRLQEVPILRASHPKEADE